MRLRSTSLSSVSHRRFSGATAGDFSWVSNVSFRDALVEAANTGLVTGFSSPTGQEQYWLRGARYPNYLSVPGATCTRTGSRAGLDAAVIYPANVARVSAGSGLRVHGAGTNLVRASEAFDDGVWVKSDATVTANTDTAPNGSLTADKLAETATTAQHVVKSNVLASGLSSGALYTYSVYLKAAERSWAVLEMQGDLGGGFAWFDLANGTIGTQTSLTGATIQSVGNGWYRCSVIDTATGTGTGVTTANIIVATANNVVNYLGTAGSGILVWGAQLEQSAFATDYIPNPNTGASSSAGADDVQVAASALPTASSIVFLIDMPAQAFTLVNGRAFEWNNVIGAVFETNAIASAVPVAPTLPSVSGLSNGGARRIAILHTVGAPTKMSVNGSATVTGTNVGGAIPATALYLGNRAALDRVLSGGITAFAAYPGSPSDAQLQAMSAL